MPNLSDSRLTSKDTVDTKGQASSQEKSEGFFRPIVRKHRLFPRLITVHENGWATSRLEWPCLCGSQGHAWATSLGSRQERP